MLVLHTGILSAVPPWDGDIPPQLASWSPPLNTVNDLQSLLNLLKARPTDPELITELGLAVASRPFGLHNDRDLFPLLMQVAPETVEAMFDLDEESACFVFRRVLAHLEFFATGRRIGFLALDRLHDLTPFLSARLLPEVRRTMGTVYTQCNIDDEGDGRHEAWEVLVATHFPGQEFREGLPEEGD